VADHCRGKRNRPRRRVSLNLFSVSSAMISRPRECVPEYKADFGNTNRSGRGLRILQGRIPYSSSRPNMQTRSSRDTMSNSPPTSAKTPQLKLGMLHQRRSLAVLHGYREPACDDKKPFAEWDVLSDEPPPWDFLTVLQKSQYNPNCAHVCRATSQTESARRRVVASVGARV